MGFAGTFSVVWPCPERDGVQYRTVRRMPLDIGTISRVMDQMAGVPSFLSVDGLTNWKAFFDLRNIFFLVDDVGIICIVPHEEGYGEAHITFWDRRLRGRDGLCRHIADELIRYNGFKCLATVIPKNRHSVLAFTKRIGFAPVAQDDDVVVLQYAPRN